MSLTVRELLASRPVESTGGILSAVREFVVYDDASPITDPIDVFELFGTSGTPDTLPAEADFFPGSTTLVATDYRITKFDGHADTFKVEWKYADASTGGQTIQPGEPGYVDVSADVGGEWVDGYRQLTASQIAAIVASGGSYPYGGQPATLVDIGGTPMDAAGDPVSISRKQITLTLGVTFSGVPNLATPYLFVGRRNNALFSGAPQGSLLYLGAGISRISINRWTQTHRFLLDQFYHMQQFPYRFPDQTAVLSSYASGIVAATTVFFRQPYPDYGNFYSISPFFAGVI